MGASSQEYEHAVPATRSGAGRCLADALGHYAETDALVLALVPGGTFVAVQVAKSLHAQLDVLVVRELVAPRQPALAIGVLVEDGQPRLYEALVAALGLAPEALADLVASAIAENARKALLFRGCRPFPGLAGRTVIVVDDGSARVHELHAALELVRARGASRLVLAVPSASRAALLALIQDLDEISCLDERDGLCRRQLWHSDTRTVRDRDAVAELYRGRLAVTIRATTAVSSGVFGKRC